MRSSGRATPASCSSPRPGTPNRDIDIDPDLPGELPAARTAQNGQQRGWDCLDPRSRRPTGPAALSELLELRRRAGGPGGAGRRRLLDRARAPTYGSQERHVDGRRPTWWAPIALCASIDPTLGAGELRAAVTSSVASTSSVVGHTATGGRLDVGALVDACTPSTGAVGGGAGGLAAANVGASSLRLDWTDGAAREQAWEVQSASGACAGWSPVATVGTGAGRAFVEGLAAGTDHCFRVRAVNRFQGGTQGAWAVLGPVRTTRALTAYTCAPATFAWVDATTGIRRTLADDASVEVALGFTFRLYGTAFTKVRVSSNGFLAFGSGSADRFVNAPIPDTVDPDGLLAAFWDDLDPSMGARSGRRRPAPRRTGASWPRGTT